PHAVLVPATPHSPRPGTARARRSSPPARIAHIAPPAPHRHRHRPRSSSADTAVPPAATPPTPARTGGSPGACTSPPRAPALRVTTSTYPHSLPAQSP